MDYFPHNNNTFHHHIHLHGEELEGLLCGLRQTLKHGFEQLVITLQVGAQQMSVEMDNLIAEVARVHTVTQSALVLIQGLADRIVEAGTDTAKLKEITDDLHASETQLAAAVEQNTPAAPSTP